VGAANVIILCVSGCDDSTYVEVTEDEVEACAILADRVNENADRHCKPTMHIYRPGQEGYANALKWWEIESEDG